MRSGTRAPGGHRETKTPARCVQSEEPRRRLARRDYGYFPHGADIGIVGRGPTPERAMEAAAAAMFGVMADIGTLEPHQMVHVEFEESDTELALVRWLNGLLAQARMQGLMLGRFFLAHARQRWAGAGWGEPWHSDAEHGVEVKGATLTMLSIRPVAGGWEARCVVDV